MRTQTIIMVLCITSIVLSACSPTSPQATLAPTLMPVTTTTKVVAVSPTSTMTPDPFSGLNQCFTWREARENCVVTYEDLMSGRLVDYARAVTKPFPDDAFGLKIERWDVMDSFIGSAYIFSAKAIGMVDEATETMLQKDSGYGVNNDVFADTRSPIGDKLFFWVESNGSTELPYDVLTEVVKVKNLDGTDGFYTLIQFPFGMYTDEEATAEGFDDIFENTMYQPPLYDATYLHRTKWDTNLGENSLIVKIYNDEETKILLDEWASTGVIPDGLKYHPLLPPNLGSLNAGDLPWEIVN